MGPERKLWHELKRNTPQITWTRIENTSLLGTPDLLGYNSSGKFFTVELKVTKSNKVRFSPHQIAFHVLHPKNTFILVKSLVERDLKLFPGTQIQQLVACGFRLDACSLGLESIIEKLEACGL
jgi:Holliday junction resolvase